MKKYILFIFSISLPMHCFYAMETEKYPNLRKIVITNNNYNNNITAKNNNPILVVQEVAPNCLIKIDNGLLTTIEGKIARITFCGESGAILSTAITTHRMSLINLSKYTKQLSSNNNPVVETFSPIVLKESLNNIQNMPFVDKGIFSSRRHQEALEAIRQNKALYCFYGQGAIIYSTEKQPNPDTYKDIIPNYIDLDPRLKPTN